MRIVWTYTAIRDLQDIRRYVERDNPSAASSIAAQILKSVNRLASHPHMGRVGRLSGTRELIINKTSYVVPYRVQEETVELLRVIHSRRQWPKRRRKSSGMQQTRKPRR